MATRSSSSEIFPCAPFFLEKRDAHTVLLPALSPLSLRSMNSGTKTYLDPRLASKDHPETFQRGVSISVTEDSPAMAKAAAEATSAAASDSAADDAWTVGWVVAVWETHTL